MTGARMKVIREDKVAATMRDGTVLRADIYRRDAAGTYPVLLCRTPYGTAGYDMHEEIGRAMAERGYIVVYQDIRGRFASEGEFRPALFTGAPHWEAEDGYDSVEWAAGLPWSNGKVGTFGNSYASWTQWALAPTRPPHLKAMFATGMAANLLDNHLGGVLRLGRRLFWFVTNAAVDTARRAGLDHRPESIPDAERLWEARDRGKWLWHLPLSQIPDHAMPGLGADWQQLISTTARDHLGFLDAHARVDVPVLSATGWYDQQIGTIAHFTGMTANGMTEHARQNQHLIVGPWTHTTVDLGRQVGDVDFGPEARRDYVDIAEPWFARWLKGEASNADDWPPVQLFVMGANKWRAEQAWPLERAKPTAYYLHSAGDASAADGTLSCDPPRDEPADCYLYDPRDPVMTLFSLDCQQCPLDQRALDGRRDILRYSTPPLDRPIEVIGPVSVRLFAASSAPDTDFVAKLMDVWPDGFVQELCYGIVRARYRESLDSPSLIEPGRIYDYTIRLTPTANLFGRGHRIRLDISSSDFPNFDRNHNTGGDDHAEVTLQSARQTVYHDAAHQSYVILPIVP